MKIIKPLTFNPFTFSRASEASVLASSGYIDFAANDVLREGYSYDVDTDSLSPSGALIESSSINYIADSNKFSKWTVVGSPAPTITDNYATSPDGTANAALFDPDGTGTQLITYPLFWSPYPSGAVFSVFLKAVAPSTAVRLTIYNETSVFRINNGDYDAFEDNARITPYPDDWFLCEIYITATTTATPQIQQISGASFLMYGAQVEPATSLNDYRATSYIRSSGSSVVNTSGTSISRVSGEAFTSYSEGQTIYITNSPTGAQYIINTITDADNMTVTTSAGSATSKILYSRSQRQADIVVSQTPSLVSSNIDEDDADVWDSGDNYVVGNTVMVLGEYHRVYEALNDNSDSYPPDNLDGDDPDWLDTGATNRWQMFDMSVGADKQSVATASGGDIDVLVQVDAAVNAIVLLNASGVTATITMRNGSGDIIYHQVVSLLGTSMGIGWWEFFFGYRGGVKTIVFTDLPTIAPATIQVEIDGSGASGLGKLIIGEAIEIGCTKFGTTLGIIDFSRKERDAFGNNYILERRFIGKVDYDIQIDSDKVDDIYDLLADLRATPAVYIGSENKFKSTVVYGFYRDFSIPIAGSKKSSCAIQVEGI